MKRLIDWHLAAWRKEKRRKPLLLKGARQIGKTYSVRQLAKRFESFIEINFELVTKYKKDLWKLIAKISQNMRKGISFLI